MEDLTSPPTRFRALFVAEPDGTPAKLREASSDDLGDGDVLIEVVYSSLNYKDGLAMTGTAPVVRTFPMIGGIDLAGTVIASEHLSVAIGDAVAVTGCGLGEEHPGGYSQYVRVPGDWCVRLPDSISPFEASVIGTAGVTAMLSFMALERNRSGPENLDGLPLVVTGASGGVGSLSILLGARLGYRVVASTGRLEERDFLARLGAGEVIDREEISGAAPVALGKVRWGAAIDSVGGSTLANLIRMTRSGGTVAACGLAGGVDLELTVHPFILRGVTLVGINSVRPYLGDRQEAWRRIAALVEGIDLSSIATTVRLEEVIDLAPKILLGQVRGRTVVNLRP